MNDKELDFELRAQALDAALSLNRNYIANRKDWQSMDVISASHVVDDAEIFLLFLHG